MTLTMKPARRAKISAERTSGLRTAVVYLLVAATLFPLLWLLINSFRNSTDIFGSLSPLSISTIIPDAITFENYVKLAESGFFHSLGNSLFIAGVSVVLGLLLGSMAAYALAVLHFPGRNIAFLIVIIGFMLPFEVVAIPLYQLFVDWSLVNTYAGLIIPGIANGLAIFNLRQAFLGVPPSMREAAIIDGASELRVFRSVYLPLNSSALINSAILIFLGQWAAYLWPLLVVSEPALQVAPVNLATAFTQYTFDFGYSFAGTVVLSIVPAVILLVFRRYFVMASLGSATKG